MSTSTPDSTRFRCALCPKEFSRRENLARHARILCGKEFTRSDVRQRHEEIHRTQQSPSVIVASQPQTASPNDNGLASPHTPSDALRDNRPADRRRVAGSAGFDPPADQAYPQVEAHHDMGHDWTPLHSLNMDIDQSDGPEAQVESRQPNHWTNESPNNSFDDDLVRWMQEPCLFEDMCFDDDIMSVLLESGSMPPFNAAPILAMDIENGQVTGSNHDQSSSTFTDRGERMIRPTSPPNEASEEDKWPYRWDPGSQAITAAKPIELPKIHSLRRHHDPSFDISQQRYERLMAFLVEPARRGFNLHSLHFPELATTNIFIGLFFARFEHQMPVIHRSSLKSCDELPDPLLAVMIAIGAIYSRERHTCRFSIVLVDMARLSSQIALEMNNRFMRDPLFVYALALICYAGLWCGNKRLFELSESLRGSVVSYCRQIHNSEFIFARDDLKRFGNSLDSQWQRWILKESRKRLMWVIYGLDCIFPCLLYLPASISLAEVMTTECPCDEDFWHAASANRWKALLGSASVPPARTFASAVSPFLGPLNLGHGSHNTSSNMFLRQTSFSSSISLNSWTRHLILTTILVQSFELSQQISMVSEATLDAEIWQVPRANEPNSPASSLFTATIEPEIQPHYAYLVTRCLSSRHPDSSLSPPEQEVCRTLAERKELISSTFKPLHRPHSILTEFLEMLLAWEHAYASLPAPDVAVYETSRYFHESSQVYHRLGHLTLHVPIVDLQNALGKSGPAEITPAIGMMHRILTNHPEDVSSMLTHCLELIRDLRVQPNSPTGESGSSRMTEPPEIIACFLGEAFVWMLVSCADPAQIRFLRDKMDGFEASDGFFAVVKEALDRARDQESDVVRKHNTSKTNLILFAAADVISKMTPWNASLNLALLLCHRGKASTAREDLCH
ncbi:uncharacterized protein N7511_006616 [Penicillium nucicola]|uniref:uncharacterized protein n=1 Tax=Penicillium nucicola TaxID=1850975 RepID=UPI0025451CD0|nr:uncharacterized protein N7511_006616 [Penicillium nucicola]KAJ5757922.1 hypothetical protein N7511_006616 [Penicillium nucicola]